MNIASAIVVYVLWWWLVFFAMLPTGVQGRWEGQDDGVEGADPGAPTEPQLKKKAIRTSIIALVLWMLTVAIILSGIFNFRE